MPLTLQIDVIASLLSGRLVRERIGPAMLSAVQSQVYLRFFILTSHRREPFTRMVSCFFDKI